MKRLSTLILIIASFLLYSCGVNSAHNEKQSKISVRAKQLNSGTVQLNDSLLTANAKPGYTFLYWKINHKNGQFITYNDDSTHINKTTVKNVIGFFGKNHLQIPAHLTADPNGRYAYYLIRYTIPVDSMKSKTLNAIVRADLLKATKQKVFITNKKIYHFEVSYTGKKIAYSIVNNLSNSGYSTYIFDLSTRKGEWLGPFTSLVWANNSHKILLGRPSGACIYYLLGNQGCYVLNLNSKAGLKSGFWAAAWSPNDKKIVVSRRNVQIYSVNSTGVERKATIPRRDQLPPNDYFLWINNKNFITTGNTMTHPRFEAKVIKRSVTNPESVKTLPFFTGSNASISPDRNKIVFTSSGKVKTYNLKTTETETLTKPIGAKQPIWMKNGRILFVASPNGYSIPYVLILNGNIRKL